MFDKKKAAAKAADRAEQAREDAADSRREDREEVALQTKAAPAVELVPYPKWIKAAFPEVGDVALIVKNAEEEAAVVHRTAEFKVTKSAQGDTYEVVLTK